MIPHSETRPAAGPASSPPAPPTPMDAAPDVPAMRARFVADFAGGRIGAHHNTFRHRERVLRQLSAPAGSRGR